ncbi:MAG: alpha-glucosidase C-terminal domain-containing protein, partial [Acidobacteriales bacterium]|nr:alpha-glucosidase C-terminal domain-containing protein [Terriglobales bacterium]
VLDFWLDLGVDGLRLDAVPYLFEREGTNCENLPETHKFLRELRAHIDSKYQDRMILAEANQWPEDSIAYFGNGDECNMAFHFPVMPRLFMGLQMEDRFPITDIMNLTPPIPENCQWAMFLRNHDELTLEMVTDEERDYMYRMYASDRPMRINLGIRRRLAPLLGNDRRRIELLNALLFSLPGTPVIYYGDEIGMGDNFYLGDRNGVRTPMQWNGDRNAGFSRATPQKLYLPVIIDPEYHYETVNVEAQQNNPNSLLWWMKRILAQRKRVQAFGRGSLEFLNPQNRKVLGFVRQYGDERVLVVANLSRFPQHVDLDLSEFDGMSLVEMFGNTEFPAANQLPYSLTLAPYGFYWILLQPRVVAPEESHRGALDRNVLVIESFEQVFSAKNVAELSRALPRFLAQRRWFWLRGRRMRTAEIIDFAGVGEDTAMLLVRVEFDEGEPELYLAALTAATGDSAEKIIQQDPSTTFARLRTRDGQMGLLYGALFSSHFGKDLLSLARNNGEVRAQKGSIVARRLGGLDAQPESSRVVAREKHHSHLAFDDLYYLKLFRKLDEGPNPEEEALRVLTEGKFKHAPKLLGTIHYEAGEENITLGLLEEYVHCEESGMAYFADQCQMYLERAMTNEASLIQVDGVVTLETAVPQPVRDFFGSAFEYARLLGSRAADMHRGLASAIDSDFAPDPFTDFYRQSLYHGFLGALGRSLEFLRANLDAVPEHLRGSAEQLLASEPRLRDVMKPLRETRFRASRTRLHGDFHLDQVLFTGKDFVFIDFEGDPSRPASERRIKASPVRDLAAMVWSFYYSGYANVIRNAEIAQRERLLQWAATWGHWLASGFVRNYRECGASTRLVPEELPSLKLLLDCYLIERACRELTFNVVQRSPWMIVPIEGLLRIVRANGGAA